MNVAYPVLGLIFIWNIVMNLPKIEVDRLMVFSQSIPL